jgi:hypothetical protein
MLIASPEESQIASGLVEALWNVFGCLEIFARFEQTALAAEEASARTEELVSEIRLGLGVGARD